MQLGIQIGMRRQCRPKIGGRGGRGGRGDKETGDKEETGDEMKQ